jgi:ferrochelatase
MGSKAFSQKTGILLIQLGTPDAPTTEACRKFLREFLMDPQVIDIPFVFRWMLVNLFILPFRSHKSAEAYYKIWSLPGGPLRFHSLQFETALSKALPEMPIALGMRYGVPTIESAIKILQARGVNRVVVAPLYPQYAASSFGTASDAAVKILKRMNPILNFEVIPPFYADEFFIKAWKDRTEQIDWNSYDHILFSYHGIPERHIRAADASGVHCLKMKECCVVSIENNKTCYRHHCFETTRAIVRELGLPVSKTSTSFQSRLGASPWIKPYTDLVLPNLAAQGNRPKV